MFRRQTRYLDLYALPLLTHRLRHIPYQCAHTGAKTSPRVRHCHSTDVGPDGLFETIHG